MPIVQDLYKIPDDIMMKISTGENIRYGGVVRNNKGQIVKHLKPIHMSEAILQYAWNNRDTLIKVGKGGLYIARNYFKSKKKQDPDVVGKFREGLKVYLYAVRNGALTMEIISDMMERLGELKIHPNSEKINIVLSVEELDVLLNQMFEYTQKLAGDNAIELTSREKETLSHSMNPIINLQHCLETQKRIFELAS
ncbi:hypothetical protein V6B33_00850 [Mangrovibacillus sp. Mu-81]|uniref:hypothetical protein n=1 Tax=Mangrovibacillus sp. Mu-81 TaxID=3121478 RepID=UPI002FE43273